MLRVLGDQFVVDIGTSSDFSEIENRLKNGTVETVTRRIILLCLPNCQRGKIERCIVERCAIIRRLLRPEFLKAEHFTSGLPKGGSLQVENRGAWFQSGYRQVGGLLEPAWFLSSSASFSGSQQTGRSLRRLEEGIDGASEDRRADLPISFSKAAEAKLIVLRGHVMISVDVYCLLTIFLNRQLLAS